MSKYSIVINPMNSAAYIKNNKIDYPSPYISGIPFESFDALIKFARRHNIVLKNEVEMTQVVEQSYIDRVSTLEFYFYNTLSMLNACKMCLDARIAHLERVAFASREDIDSMPICQPTIDAQLKRLEDKVESMKQKELYNVSYNVPRSYCTVSGSLNLESNSSCYVQQVAFYKPKMKVGNKFVLRLGNNTGIYSISTIALCYSAKSENLVLAYCCGREKNFNCEILDNFFKNGDTLGPAPDGTLL